MAGTSVPALRIRRIELENARHHDDRLRPVAALEPREFQRLGAIDEQPAMQPPLIPNHPMAAAVAADQVERHGGLRVSRLRSTHDTFPLMSNARRRIHMRDDAAAWISGSSSPAGSVAPPFGHE